MSSYRLHLQDNSVIQISLSTSPNSFASVALDGLFQGLRIRTVLLEAALENIENLIHAKVRYSKSSCETGRSRFLEFHIKLTRYFVIILH